MTSPLVPSSSDQQGGVRIRLLLVAVLAALLGGALWYLHLQRLRQEIGGGEKVGVLVALEPLRRGQPLGEAQLGVRDVPADYLDDRFVPATERERVLGLRLRRNLATQQSLLWLDVIASGDQPGAPSTLVPPGSRAVALPVTEQDDWLGLLRSGDFVDVIANLPDGEAGGLVATVLVQRVLVIAVGGELRRSGAAESGSQTHAAGVTVAVTLEQAARISAALAAGSLRVALRHPEDLQLFEDVPEVVSSSLHRAGRNGADTLVRTGPVRLGGEAL